MPTQPKKKRSLARAAAAGGAGGLLLGGFGLLGMAARTLLVDVDCTGLSAEQCVLEASVAQELVLRQTLFGGALAFLGLALLILLRRPSES